MAITKTRIDLLDVFRFIAIFLVIFFHYFSAFARPGIEVPHSSPYSEFILFKYGYLGVELFFMISGFVIFLTLENCRSIKSFFIKRIIRLFPAMLVCSVFTYIAVSLIDHDMRFPGLHRPLESFLPSLTFTDTFIWEPILGKKVGYIDGAYWSLAVEVKFYILSACLYFIDKKNFLRNWLLLSLFSVGTQIILIQDPFGFRAIRAISFFSQAVNFLLFPKYITFFTLGIFFYKKFMRQAISPLLMMGITVLFMMQLFFVELVKNDWIEKSFILSFAAIFILFVYKREWLQPVSNKMFAGVGLASYSLYLIHQSVGIILIHYLHNQFGGFVDRATIVVLVILIMVVVALLIYTKIEKPVMAFGKRLYES